MCSVISNVIPELKSLLALFKVMSAEVDFPGSIVAVLGETKVTQSEAATPVYALAGLPLNKVTAVLILAAADPVFLSSIWIIYGLPVVPAPVTYAVVNSTFSYLVNELPRPSSQYATAMDMVMAMATMMMVAMTGLTAFTFPRRVLFSFKNFNFFSSKTKFLHFYFFKSRRFSVAYLQLKSRWY